MIKIKPLVAYGALILSLSACSTYQENFDCSPGLGVGCKSISAVDKLVDQRVLPSQQEEDEVAYVSSGANLNPAPESLIIEENKPLDITTNISDSSQNNQLRVWLPGSTDAQGNSHDARVVYIPTSSRRE